VLNDDDDDDYYYYYYYYYSIFIITLKIEHMGITGTLHKCITSLTTNIKHVTNIKNITNTAKRAQQIFSTNCIYRFAQ